MSGLRGATGESARREALHAAESTDNQKTHDGKWQQTCSIIRACIRHRLNLGEAWFGLQCHCMLFGIQCTECLLS